MQQLYTKIKLEIVGADVIIENADISVDLKKSDDGTPNYCTVTIYNLSENTYTLLNSKTTHMRVYTDTNDKAYVLLLGEAISYELRKTNVKLLTLCPGPFLSEFVKKAHNDYTFSKIKPITSDKVALFGYKKSKKGKSLAIVGFKNRLTIFLAKLAPRKFVTSSSAKTMKNSNKNKYHNNL